MTGTPMATIERRLVDYFDHIGLGFTVEKQGLDWVAVRDEVEFSLSELALALAADFRPSQTGRRVTRTGLATGSGLN